MRLPSCLALVLSIATRRFRVVLQWLSFDPSWVYTANVSLQLWRRVYMSDVVWTCIESLVFVLETLGH